MEENSRNQRLQSIADQVACERNIVYTNFSKLLWRGGVSERGKTCTIYKEDVMIQIQCEAEPAARSKFIVKKVNKDDQIGMKQLIELKTQDPVITPFTQSPDQVELLPTDFLGDSVKMPFEYGFKEKVKLAKLKGGKPRQVRVKKERQLINLSGGTQAPAKVKREQVKGEIKDEV